jgi:outer membrane protein insertion porin family
LRLRGALLTALAWALMATFAGPAAASNDAGSPLPTPTQESAAQENPPSQPAGEGTKSQPAQSGTSSYEGLGVASVEFPGVSQADLERLRQLIPQKSGEPLDRDRIRESIQALHATGRFDDVRVEATRTGDGRVVLSFITTANYFVGQITVEGTPNRPTENQVANASKFQLGEVFTGEKLDRALSGIKRLMEENGYYQSTVSADEQKHPQTEQIDIRFSIRPGPQAHVGHVTVTGTPGYSEGQIQDIAKVHPGDPVTMQLINRALDRLHKKYQKRDLLLAQVVVSSRTYRPAANAVDYTFDIAAGPKVNIITEGFRISRSVLKRTIPVYEEGALDDDLLNEGRRNLLNYLQSKGHFDAKVDLKKSSPPGGNELRVVYDIDAGPHHKLVKVEIAGNMVGDKGFPEETLRSRMQVQPAGRFFSKGRYSQALLNDDIRGLEDMYRANGFQQVKITSTVDDNYGGRANQLAVKLEVNLGPQTLVEALQIIGNKTFSEDDLRKIINTQENQAFSEYYIAQDRDNILNYYFNRGFPDATFQASAKPSSSNPNRVDVTFTIREGERVFVDQVLVSGLNYTRPVVVQREVQVKSGEPLSQIDMLETQRKLYDLGIFSQVDTAVQNPEGTEREKNVLVVVQEAKRYTFNYGVGFEFQTGQPSIGTSQPLGQTGVSPRVSFGVTRINLRGRNNSVTFKTNVGRLQQRGLISYDAPRLFKSPDWRLTLTGFYDNTVDITTFTSQRLESSIQAEQILAKNSAGKKTSLMDYRFTYRRVKASNLEIGENLIPLLSLPTRVGMPGFSYIRNHRDDDLETTKGSYNTVDAGVADGHFGSEADFSRVLIQNSTYYSFGKQGRKFVFARSTRIGVETAYGNTSILPPGQSCPQLTQTTCSNVTLIPLPERFLSGGGNSHRGFGLNQAGPRDPVTGFPIGGSGLFLNNLELRMPPPTLPFFQENISFAIFHDAGNVFVNGRDMLDNLLRWQQKNSQSCFQTTTANQCDYSYISHAIGLGVRYKTPVGPVRFDFGYNLNPPAFPSCQTTPNSSTPAQKAYCLTNSDNSLTYFAPQHASHFNVYFSIGQTF